MYSGPFYAEWEDVISKLRLIGWEGYEGPGMAAPFTERTGIAVEGESIPTDTKGALRFMAAGADGFDIVNLNNPFARGLLDPKGAIRPLDVKRFGAEAERWIPAFRDLFDCSLRADGSAILGVCQRFGPFNFVINANAVSPATARVEGFNLASDPAMRQRYGILEMDDFNVFHICIATGLDPFSRLDGPALERFSDKARAWFANAAIVSGDHMALNRALAAGDIDVYFSGGSYTASPARLEGRTEIMAVTPDAGPIGGKGGIAFAEVTSVAAWARDPVAAEDYLAYLMEPESAHRAAFIGTVGTPVAQMGDAGVFGRFTAAELDALQWETLEDDIRRCEPYRLAPQRELLLDRLMTAKNMAAKTAEYSSVPGRGAPA